MKIKYLQTFSDQNINQKETKGIVDLKTTWKIESAKRNK